MAFGVFIHCQGSIYDDSPALSGFGARANISAACSSTRQLERYRRCESTIARTRISCGSLGKIASNNERTRIDVEAYL